MVFPYATVWSLFQRASQTKRKLKVMVLTIDSETAAPGGGARRFHVWAPRATSRSAVTPTSFSPQVVEVAEDEPSEVLPGWDYADAFECRWSSEGGEDAMTVARALLGPSRSAERVLAARDLLVAPFGVRPAHQGDALLFPIQAAEPERVVCGLDDRHLDFRVIVTLSGGGARCTTVVRRHGALGAAYLAVVRPIHRRFIPHLMRRHHRTPAMEAAAS